MFLRNTEPPAVAASAALNSEGKPMSEWICNERNVRHYASHLALTVRRRGNSLELSERYGPPHGEKRKIGTYRSWRSVERAIDRGEMELRRLKRQKRSRACDMNGGALQFRNGREFV